MDVTPLPHISSILEELRGKALFSKFNIRAGYNNIRIRTEDTYKTGFKTNKGLYKWIVMPFGLCTALATYTRMLNEILCPLYTKYPGMFRHYIFFFNDTANPENYTLPLHVACGRFSRAR